MRDGRAAKLPWSRRRRVLEAVALVALVAPLALAARWRWAASPDGRQLRPRPDALEYAAAAQAIAAEGRYYLQVGPYRVRPRYPPGWPMVLACAVRLGVGGDQLWRVTGLFGAALACLLALVAAGAVWRLAGGAAATTTGARAAGGALAAGLLAGLGWALAPLAVAVGRVALADEPAALVACLLLLGTGMAAAATRWPAPAALGGASFGLLAAMRPASALLFAPAALVLAAGGWRAHGGRWLLRRAAVWAAAAAVVPLLVAGLLWRSQLSPWRWSGYALWAPRWYADAGVTYNLRYALRGNDDFERGSGARPIPNLQFYAQVLLGVPGLARDSYLGQVWPALGWLAGLLLVLPRPWKRRRRRPGPAAARAPGAADAAGAADDAHLFRTAPLAPDAADTAHLLRIAALAAGVTLAAHDVAFSLYFFPAARFVLAPLAFPLLAAAVACGLGIAGLAPGAPRSGAPPGDPPPATPQAPARPWLAGWGAALAAAALATAIVVAFLGFRRDRGVVFPGRDLRVAVAAWQRLPEPARATTTMPFDPVEAQALGLLPPALVRQIRAWGALPPTVEVRRLRALAVIPAPLSP